MNRKKIITMRFFLNFIIFAAILISTTYYTYTNQPGLYALKDYLVPITGIIILAIILSITFAFVNELITTILVKIFGGK